MPVVTCGLKCSPADFCTNVDTQSINPTGTAKSSVSGEALDHLMNPIRSGSMTGPGSNGKTCFQSFFMLTMVQLAPWACS